jgi:hypothetical protein
MWDVLHHIISPSFFGYIDGKHNESVLNSCPIHNYKHPDSVAEIPPCHIGNEAYLFKEETVKMLLKLVLHIQTNIFGHQLKPIDREFMSVYKKYYN